MYKDGHQAITDYSVKFINIIIGKKICLHSET